MNIKNTFNKIIAPFKFAVAVICSFIPTRLPIGMAEFDKWAGEVLAVTNLPDNQSTRFSLASLVPYLNKDQYYVSKFYIGKLLQKGAANQIAMGKMTEIKEAAVAAQKQAEVTAPKVVALSEVKQ